MTTKLKGNRGRARARGRIVGMNHRGAEKCHILIQVLVSTSASAQIPVRRRRRRTLSSSSSFMSSFLLCCLFCIITLLELVPTTQCFFIPNHQQQLFVRLPFHFHQTSAPLYVSSSSSSPSSSSSSYQGRRGGDYKWTNTNTNNNDNNNNINRPIHIKKKKWRSRSKNNNSRKPPSPIEIQRRLENAKDVENRLSRALERTREFLRSTNSSSNSNSNSNNINKNYNYNIPCSNENGVEAEIGTISFPSVRECNSALAIMGDTDDFKRALQLFSQMRKSQMIVSLYNSKYDNDDDHRDDHHDGSNYSGSVYEKEEVWKGGNVSTGGSSGSGGGTSSVRGRMYLYPPSPTLVTYSTLMSRAVKLGKERVALRLWKLMILQEQFYTNLNSRDWDDDTTEITEIAETIGSSATTATTSTSTRTNSILGAPIVPDIKAVNILMNVFAKMADHESAILLMEQLYTGNIQRYYDDPSSSSSSSLIQVVPKLKPNIVTYNTLIDACHRAGDLDAGELKGWKGKIEDRES